MRKIVRRPRAGKDLKDIWCHTFSQWGEAQADKYLAEIEAAIMRLQQHPHLGRSRKDVRAGYYSLSVNRHVVYYVLTPSLIRIIRVLHARMDPDLHL